MINDLDITYNLERDRLRGAPLTFVIDGECVYDFVVTEEGVNLFTKNTGIRDISSEYPSHNGSTLEITKDDGNLEIFQTSEYFGAILLSNPTVVNVTEYPYGHHVVSPNASFDGTKFIIKNRSVSEMARLTEWHSQNPKNPNYVAP